MPITSKQSPKGISYHPSFPLVSQKLQKWQVRLNMPTDASVLSCQSLFYFLVTKKFLDHRSISHIARIVLSLSLLQKKLEIAFAASPETRHLFFKWIPARLSFSFSSQSVMGCLIAFNLKNRYDVFDETNLSLFLQKNHPGYHLVHEGIYRHVLVNPHLHLMYFEIEKEDLSSFVLQERRLLKDHLENYLKSCFETLIPTIFKRKNQEEIFKTILTLSREVHSAKDLAQLWIQLDHHTPHNIVFQVVMAYPSTNSKTPNFQAISSSTEASYVLDHHVTVKQLATYRIEACVFQIHLLPSLAFIRSDGAIDFYASRQKVVSLLEQAIGEFRDFNGGGLSKQQELLKQFKESCSPLNATETELIETFFYNLEPLEKQMLLPCKILVTLFQQFLDIRFKPLEKAHPYLLSLNTCGSDCFVSIKLDPFWKDFVRNIFSTHEFKSTDLTYTLLKTSDGLFLSAHLANASTSISLINLLKKRLTEQNKKIKQPKVLRIGTEFLPVSLDPRLGSDLVSTLILHLLFEGLTRYGKNQQIINGMAKTINVSSDFKHYLFKLRHTCWNNGTPVTAYDFEYAWKKTLSPDSENPNSHLFYCILHAQEAKAGKRDLQEVGITAHNATTLEVKLAYPTPYFLDLTAQPCFYPVCHAIDHVRPYWPHQTFKNYLCNGPFQLTINDIEHKTFRLEQNPLYCGKMLLDIDEIVLTQVNRQQALQAFQRNELDWIGNPWGVWSHDYIPQDEEQKIIIPEASVSWLTFNTTASPFHQSKVRQAFAYALNRLELAENPDLALRPAYSILHPYQTCGPEAAFPEQDLNHARKLLSEGLAELGIAREKFSSLSLLYCDLGFDERVIRTLQNQIQRAFNITCVLEPYPWGTLFQRAHGGNFELCLIKWTPRTADPITTFSAFQHAMEKSNLAKWEHPHFRECWELSHQEVDPNKRRHYLVEMEKLLAKEMPMIPLFFQPYQALVKKDFAASIRHLFQFNNVYETLDTR